MRVWIHFSWQILHEQKMYLKLIGLLNDYFKFHMFTQCRATHFSNTPLILLFFSQGIFFPVLWERQTAREEQKIWWEKTQRDGKQHGVFHEIYRRIKTIGSLTKLHISSEHTCRLVRLYHLQGIKSHNIWNVSYALLDLDLKTCLKVWTFASFKIASLLL